MRLTRRLGALDGCPHDSAYGPAMHAVHARPRPRAGGAGQACRHAAGWVGRGDREGDTSIPLGWGGRQGGGRGWGGGGLSGAPCTSAESGGYGYPPCAVSSGTCSTHVHSRTAWAVWAFSLVHVTTGWRVRRVLRLCSQPPPRYQSRGYRSAAIAAPGPLRTLSAVAAALLPTLARYNRGVMGVHVPHSSCCARSAPVAARSSQQVWHSILTIAMPASLCIAAQGGRTGSRPVCTTA